LLGVLKAGGAYLPLDSTYPRERLAFMAADSGVQIVLSQSKLAELLPDVERTVFLDTDWDRIAAQEGPDSETLASPDNLSYIIYTSGSTGRPKGVMVPHRGVVNYLSWAAGAYGAATGEGAPLHSPLGFDLTVTSLFLPLLAGNSVKLVPEDRGADALANMLRSQTGFTLLKVTPAHLALLGQTLAHDDLAGRVGTLILGGEALLGENVAPWRERLAGTSVINEYGPTEATVGCCVYEVPAEGALAGSVPIGKPIANTRLLLLDAGLRPVPEGVPGELYIGGDGLARGYLGRPDLTAERFVPDPFAGRETPAPAGSRLYKTGDLARLLPDGNLDFLGRNDHQVKVRGVRIELGEVEAALAAHPAVRETAVMAREDTPGDRRLVAYFTTAAGQPLTIDELRRFLTSRLPDAMLPAVFVPLPALPLTANGKLDRAALPAPSSQRPDLEREYVAPRTPQEEMLAEVWAEVLGIDKVGVLDSFFALGGDSIRSVRVVALAKERGMDLTVEQLFRYQTIESLIQGIGGDSLGIGDEDEDLARLVAELETLSEEEAQQRLRQQIAAVEETT
ncbi:MAG TPA: amino acid adenylation domain-containing protein, partial [Thermoanaerobaculia bacterium]|nr:amino acid adenylation domain-containing protein [Thermoanaerobaculia bacterium]